MKLISTESEFIAKDETQILLFIMSASIDDLIECLEAPPVTEFDRICILLIKHRLETFKRTEDSMLTQLRYHRLQDSDFINDLPVKFAEGIKQ
jgi:hypothetical protein